MVHLKASWVGLCCIQ